MTMAFIIAMCTLLLVVLIAKYMLDEAEDERDNARLQNKVQLLKIQRLQKANARKTKYIAQLERQMVHEATPRELAGILTRVLSAEGDQGSDSVHNEGSTESSGSDDSHLPDDALSDR